MVNIDKNKIYIKGLITDVSDIYKLEVFLEGAAVKYKHIVIDASETFVFYSRTILKIKELKERFNVKFDIVVKENILYDLLTSPHIVSCFNKIELKANYG